MSEHVHDILICGVGGQGILLASEVLSDVALLADLDVKKSEVHGMAQRGGSVVSHVRMGPQVHGSLIQRGHADVLLAFEKLEALRWLPYVKEGGHVLVNTMSIAPMSVTLGQAEYPEDVDARLRATGKPVFVDGLGEAQKLGNPRCANVILLGVLSTKLDLPEALWQKALEKRIKAKYLDLNRKAFQRGRELGA